MAAPEGFYANVTLTDVQLASAYYPLLVDSAKEQRCLSYGELVNLTKAQYPGSTVVQRAIAVSTGRRLDVVRMFTQERGHPDLTSLVINKGSGECGVGFTKHFDPVLTRETVFSFDWSAVDVDFAAFVKHTETEIKPRKKVKEPKALELMSTYYQLHRETLPASVRQLRELIVDLIMEGFSAEEAFERAMQAQD